MADVDPQKTFNVHDAKTNLSKLIDRAHAGEEIVLAKAGEPRAKIVPYDPPMRKLREPGRFKHLLKDVSCEDVMAPCFTDEELEAMENADIFPPQT
ncbi:MAG TPA: type II toxin-antitoxin system prevent-host-death family antitoxin [Sphingomonas sp.]|jgi:prevent-host-death family protein|nr:type II toxin-antitoxin system prevent-host-death family antitoxin [Sphingomonas sp.]